MNTKEKARKLLEDFKDGNYAFGIGVLKKAGVFASELGNKVMVIAAEGEWLESSVAKIVASIEETGAEVVGEIVTGALPNAPREDVYRIESSILHYQPDCLIAIGGGSTIDAVKAANVLASLGKYSNDIETYFGTGQVTAAMEKTGSQLIPLIAVQTAASSAAHLTKYSNVTDPEAGQKKLIVDEAIIPLKAVFDYSITTSAPASLTIDGAFDGIAHSLEVFYGISDNKYDKAKEIAATCIELVVNNIQEAIKNPESQEAREALGLATDLGGYAIMVGGTNGGHLTSFSLVDVTSHGRACAIMNPYYTVFFAPAIEKQLSVIKNIFKEAGFIKEDNKQLNGKELGRAVAEGMIKLSASVGFPTKLGDLAGFNDKYITRALEAAKNPQLDMKLKNMPVPLNASLIDDYMGPILEAAKTGDFDKIVMLGQ